MTKNPSSAILASSTKTAAPAPCVAIIVRCILRLEVQTKGPLIGISVSFQSKFFNFPRKTFKNERIMINENMTESSGAFQIG